MIDAARLEAFLAREWGARAVTVTGLAPLAGGAIQENWGLRVAAEGGAHPGAHDLVLRLDAPSALPMSHGRAEEFALLLAARGAGVTVPEPLALCRRREVLGRPFLLTTRLPGSAEPRALTAAGPHPGLARALGGELARLHTVAPPDPALGFLGPAPADAAAARTAELRGLLDRLPEPQPGIEYGLNWLDRHAPAPVPPVLCHRDARTGNLLVEDGRLTALLDWEFAAWSDPAEDLGWLTAPCWRFDRPDLEAGGLAPLDALLGGYVAAGGQPARARPPRLVAGARHRALGGDRARAGRAPPLRRRAEPRARAHRAYRAGARHRAPRHDRERLKRCPRPILPTCSPRRARRSRPSSCPRCPRTAATPRAWC
jgi:aminoglycoside phosphotransferase (APT) family kinase protein